MAKYDESHTVHVAAGDSLVLIARTGPLQGSRFNLGARNHINVGRDLTANISLSTDDTVSREHCRFLRIGAECAVVDLGSSNGTLVNDAFISGEPHRLSIGDRIIVGRTEFELVDKAPPSLAKVVPKSSPPSHTAAVALHDVPSHASLRLKAPQHASELREFIHSTAAKLAQVLKELGVTVKEIDANAAQAGPMFVRFKIRVGAKAKLSALQSRAKDIGRELATQAAPFIDNVPGENFIGIDIVHPFPKVLELSNADLRLPSSPGSIPFVVGVALDGHRLQLDLSTLPHLLVAGAPGSGKTIFIQSLLLTAMSSVSSNALEIAIVDPKRTDFASYQGVPHLRGRRVLQEPDEAIEYLRGLLENELPRRTKILERAQKRNLKEYLASAPRETLRPLLVMVDEYADLVMQFDRKDRKDFERDVCRLAQRARSVGIHLVIATQRPSVDVITGLIKANLPCRVALRLPQANDSKTILDTKGAENLIGRGDLLLLHEDGIVRYQGFNVSEQFLKSTLKTLR